MKEKHNWGVLINYLLIAALVALIVMNSKYGEYKLGFWIFISVTGIAAFITRFVGIAASKNPVIIYARHITFIGVLALLIMWAVIMTLRLNK